MGERDEAIQEQVETEELELDGDGDLEEIDEVMRDAVAAVEEVQGHRGGRQQGSAAGAVAPEEETAEKVREASEEDVERLKKEIADLRDRSVRTLADFDNFRKRMERERNELRRYALTEPLRDLLDVVDNLERAVSASGTLEDLKAGVEMTLRQMLDILRQYGVREVVAQGEPFDPNLHEAVDREEKSDIETPEVVEELQRGYLLHERLLRPARVKVAVPPETAAGDRGAGEA